MIYHVDLVKATFFINFRQKLKKKYVLIKMQQQQFKILNESTIERCCEFSSQILFKMDWFYLRNLIHVFIYNKICYIKKVFTALIGSTRLPQLICQRTRSGRIAKNSIHCPVYVYQRIMKISRLFIARTVTNITLALF